MILTRQTKTYNIIALPTSSIFLLLRRRKRRRSVKQYSHSCLHWRPLCPEACYSQWCWWGGDGAERGCSAIFLPPCVTLACSIARLNDMLWRALPDLALLHLLALSSSSSSFFLPSSFNFSLSYLLLSSSPSIPLLNHSSYHLSPFLAYILTHHLHLPRHLLPIPSLTHGRRQG